MRYRILVINSVHVDLGAPIACSKNGTNSSGLMIRFLEVYC